MYDSVIEELTGQFYYAHQRNHNAWRENCTGFDLCEDQKCRSDCVRCEGVLIIRPFVCSFLGNHGHDAGE